MQEAQRVPNKIKDENNIEKSRAKQRVTNIGNPIWLSADFSALTLRARKERQNIIKMFKERNPQPRRSYPTRLSFKIKEEIKSFQDKQKLREFTTIEC